MKQKALLWSGCDMFGHVSTTVDWDNALYIHSTVYALYALHPSIYLSRVGSWGATFSNTDPQSSLSKATLATSFWAIPRRSQASMEM